MSLPLAVAGTRSKPCRNMSLALRAKVSHRVGVPAGGEVASQMSASVMLRRNTRRYQ